MIVPVAVERRGSERRKGQRRRQIDPTTCERDYSQDEIEFMRGIKRVFDPAGIFNPGKLL